jgi:hypothetical protein
MFPIFAPDVREVGACQKRMQIPANRKLLDSGRAEGRTDTRHSILVACAATPETGIRMGAHVQVSSLASIF